MLKTIKGANVAETKSGKVPAHLKRYDKYRVKTVTNDEGAPVYDEHGELQFEHNNLKPIETLLIEERFAEELNRQSHNSGVRYYECA